MYTMASLKQQIDELRSSAYELFKKLVSYDLQNRWEQVCEASLYVFVCADDYSGDWADDATEQDQILYWKRLIAELTEACQKKAREDAEEAARWRLYINPDGTCRAHDLGYCAQCRRSAEGRPHPDEWM